MRDGVVSGVTISRGWRGWEMSVSSLKKRSDSYYKFPERLNHML